MSGRPPPQFSRFDGLHGQRYNPHAAHQDRPPSSTLLLRGLARSVNDEMVYSLTGCASLEVTKSLTAASSSAQILDALQSFRPVQARTMYDKTTGDSRGFAFVDFDSVESAMQAVKAFESKPLVLQHRSVNVSYTDGFRRRSNEAERSRDLNWHQDDQQRKGERWQPRADWFCEVCNATNFARRTVCFQCNTPKSQLKEMAAKGARSDYMSRTGFQEETGGTKGLSVPRTSLKDNEMGTRRRGNIVDTSSHGVPSQVLVVRMLPPDIEEGELHVAFAEFDGVQDIRLIRDRITDLSRGFGFVEFQDVHTATKALQQCNNLIVQNTRIEVSYARDTLSTRSQHVTELHPGPRTGSSMVVTALEQAQWSLSQGRGVDVATTDQPNSVIEDVSALLDQAAAAIAPRFEEPKKMWPFSFETAGGSYVYVSEYGVYWDPDSLFYYDAQTAVYHNSFTGRYYRCIDSQGSGESAYQEFTPPLPIDEAAFHETLMPKESTMSKPALSLSLKKEKKKAGGLSLAIKTTAFSTTSAMEKVEQVQSLKSSSSLVCSSAGVAVGMKRKSADNIAKWSQRKLHEAGNLDTAPLQPIDHASKTAFTEKTASSAVSKDADSVFAALTDVHQEVPICLLCRRKFGSLEMLRKHEQLSKLHLTNLAKANENKQRIAAQYREHEKEVEREAKKQRRQEARSTAAGTKTVASSSELDVKSVPLLESGIGGKMLKMMGWKSGEGLGKHKTGRTAPIEATGQGGRSETAGLGSKAPLASSVDLSNVTSKKEQRQRLAQARYDNETA